MSLIQCQPQVGLSRWLDHFFPEGDDFLGWDLSPASYPKVDIVEDKDHYIVKAELPGLDKKDIEVKVENGILTIQGEKKNEVEKKEKGNYYYFERSYGQFSRSFRLPSYIESENVQANYKEGLLTLKLKKKEEAKTKAIEIQVD